MTTFSLQPSLITGMLEEVNRLEESDRIHKLASDNGAYHVGGSGTVVEQPGTPPEVIGNCHRRALLRSQGIEPVALPRERIMWAAGRANELYWQQLLARANPDFLVLNEGDISFEWHTEAGTRVIGHPDGFLARLDPDSPIEVAAGTHAGAKVRLLKSLELKRTSSMWKARDVGFGSKPSSDHLIQTAHYTWKLSEMQGSPIETEIWYTVDVKYYWPNYRGWAEMTKLLASQPDRVEFNPQGAVKDIVPFRVGYLAGWAPNGQYAVAPAESPGDLTYTNITVESVRAYFRLLDQCQANKTLGPRPGAQTVTGETQRWSRCDPRYCPYSATCDRYEHQYDQWFAAARELCKPTQA